MLYSVIGCILAVPLVECVARQRPFVPFRSVEQQIVCVYPALE